MSEYLLVLSTCPDNTEAGRIAHALVTEQLAGCVQILPSMQSVYRWQGNVESAAEHLLLIKTSHANFERIQSRIADLHPYQTPEIIGIPITAGSSRYLAWLEGALQGESRA
jgi:periplasmic divalent cation tolerance protein